MSIKPVEWVLVVRYNLTAHRATYKRNSGTLYSKDYIQLSRKADFIANLEAAFPELAGSASSAAITYRWPTGSAAGTLVKKSADRPHLAWGTKDAAPAPWKMSEHPTAHSAETIKGDPSHLNDADAAADAEYDALVASGFGQPFLIAVKLRGEAATLHLRVYVANAAPEFDWASLNKAPPEIQDLAARTSTSSALAWQLFSNGDQTPGLHFDASRKTDPWRNAGEEQNETIPSPPAAAMSQSSNVDRDDIAEVLDSSGEEVADLEQRFDAGDYEVPDATATVKTRGSAQRVFAKKVKENYGWRCAITGIKTRNFLVASHIVPWSMDEMIRLDPANGICLSVLVDRAFENGFIVVQDDLTINIDWNRLEEDVELKEQLGRFDGTKVATPEAHPPKAEYLQRRRAL